jgi:hypothetical protein
MLKNEPVLTAASISSAIVAIAALFHVVVDLSTVSAVVAVVLPLVAAVIARSKVSPVKSR